MEKRSKPILGVVPTADSDGVSQSDRRNAMLLDHVQLVLKTYTRAFLSQGIGLVGLFWCLSESQAVLGIILAILLLTDQAVFLRARFAPEVQPVAFHAALNTWCLGVSLTDALILFAVGYRVLGLNDRMGNPGLNTPLDSLAFSVATFGHVDIALVASTAGGRMLTAIESLLGYAVTLWLGFTLVRTALKPRRSINDSEE